MHVHRGAQLVGVGQGQEFLGSSVVAGGGSEYLATGANQGNGGTKDTETGHCISFKEREAGTSE
ncbi:hypothetical protein D9M73_257350 [compost metagenome]